MRVIEQTELSRWEQGRRRRRTSRRWRTYGLSLLIVIAVSIGALLRYNRPLPAPVFSAEPVHAVASKPRIAWPAYGQAAIGTVEDGWLDGSNSQQPMPIASVAKVLTALVVLDKKPLRVGEQGPSILLTAADEQLYRDYIAKGGSVSGVTAGKTISEYEALQAILLPSSNNMSETLTNWAFGSQEAYLVVARAFVQKHKLLGTTIADASGFSPETRSTANDLVTIGFLAMKHPVIAAIVGQSSARSDVAGSVQNVNRLLGVDGIVGIKTGNTDEAGGCYLVASTRVLADGKPKTLVAAIIGAPTLAKAMVDSRPLLNQISTGFSTKTVVQAGQRIGTIRSSWGAESAVVVQRSVSAFTWAGAKPVITVTPKLAQLSKGASAGTAQIAVQGATSRKEIVLANDVTPPSWQWRVTRIVTF